MEFDDSRQLSPRDPTLASTRCNSFRAAEAGKADQRWALAPWTQLQGVRMPGETLGVQNPGKDEVVRNETASSVSRENHGVGRSASGTGTGRTCRPSPRTLCSNTVDISATSPSCTSHSCRGSTASSFRSLGCSCCSSSRGCSSAATSRCPRPCCSDSTPGSCRAACSPPQRRPSCPH